MSLIVKTNPVGIDFYIRKLQEKLYNKLTAKWGTDVRFDCYGRCDRTKTKDGYQALIYKSNNEYGDVYFDDAAHDVVSFFGIADSARITEETEIDVHLVVFANISFKSSTKRMDEEIRKDIYDVLRSDPYGFKLTEQKTGLQTCLSEYSGNIRDNRLQFFDTHPHHVFRFDMTKRYDLGEDYVVTEVDPNDTVSGGGSSGGSSGGSGGGSSQIGTPNIDPTEYENLVYWDMPITNATGLPFRIQCAKDFYVNWGNGVLKYTGSLTQFASGSFTSNSATVRLYVADNETNITIKAVKHTIGTITGLKLPNTVEVLDISRTYDYTRVFNQDNLLNSVSFPTGGFTTSITKAPTTGLTSLPLDLFPDSLITLYLDNNSLSSSVQDDLIDYCNNLQGNITLQIGLQKPNATPSNMIAVQQLVNKGSNVVINQGFGNGYGLFRIESFEASSVNVIPNEYTLTHKINLSSVGNSAVSVGLQNPIIVDWGNGKIYSYQDASMVRCQYLDETDIQIKVYARALFANTDVLGRIYVEGQTGQTVNLDSIEQIADADYINISKINTTVSGLAPVLADKHWIRVESNLSVSDVNDLIDMADATNGNVLLMVRQIPPAVPTNPLLASYPAEFILHD